MNSYLHLEKDPHTGRYHPLLSGFEDATRIINGANWSHVDGKSDAFRMRRSPLCPSYPDLPMEEVFPRPAETDIAGVYVREIGRGRVVYFPWDVDRTFWEVLDVDHGKLLRNAVLWATNEPPPVVGERPRRSGCFDLDAERIDDGSPCESDQSDDDERSCARNHSSTGATGDNSSSRRPTSQRGTFAGGQS